MNIPPTNELKRMALSVFEEPNGITWHEVIALLEFFDDVEKKAGGARHEIMASHIRLLAVLDYLKVADTITDAQYERLAALADSAGHG